METVLSEDGGRTEDHALAARDARYKQEQLKVSGQPCIITLSAYFWITCVLLFLHFLYFQVLVEDLSQHLNTLHHFRNTDDNGCPQVPIEKLDEIKKRLENKIYFSPPYWKDQNMLCFEHGMLVSLSGFLSMYKTSTVQFADLRWSFQQGRPSFFSHCWCLQVSSFLADAPYSFW